MEKVTVPSTVLRITAAQLNSFILKRNIIQVKGKSMGLVQKHTA